MPNPKRSRMEEEFIKSGGGNIHRKNPMSADEQKRIHKKISRKLRGKA